MLLGQCVVLIFQVEFNVKDWSTGIEDLAPLGGPASLPSGQT